MYLGTHRYRGHDHMIEFSSHYGLFKCLLPTGEVSAETWKGVCAEINKYYTSKQIPLSIPSITFDYNNNLQKITIMGCQQDGKVVYKGQEKGLTVATSWDVFYHMDPAEMRKYRALLGLKRHSELALAKFLNRRKVDPVKLLKRALTKQKRLKSQARRRPQVEG